MSQNSADASQVERLTFFSDAVFAIAITLLVIELKLPALRTPDAHGFLIALVQMTADFIGFIVSFFVIGAYWAAHHRAFRWVRRCDDKLIWRNLRFLLLIAFLPFPTAVMSEYSSVPSASIFYCIVLAGATINQMLLWRYALRNPAIVALDAPAAEIRTYFRRSWFLLGATVICGLLCLVVPVMPVSTFWILPVAIRIATLDVVRRLAEKVNPQKTTQVSSPGA